MANRHHRFAGGKPRGAARLARSPIPVVTHTPERPLAWGLLIGAILVLAILAAYWPSLHGTLLWDDDAHITKPELQSFRGLERIWFDLGATQQYYPLLHSLFWLQYRIWGEETFGYHLTNVILHALAAVLVVFVIRRLGLAGAWLCGFIFALHPICVETAAWISEQKNTLSAVFCLGSARLMQAIRLVATGEAWVDQKVIQLLADRYPKYEDRWWGTQTPREQAVLKGIVDGLSNRKIGTKIGTSESTIKATVQQLFNKAGVRTRSQLVRIALEGLPERATESKD